MNKGGNIMCCILTVIGGYLFFLAMNYICVLIMQDDLKSKNATFRKSVAVLMFIPLGFLIIMLARIMEESIVLVRDISKGGK